MGLLEPYKPELEKEQVLHGLLCWNKYKSANYLNCKQEELIEACQKRKLTPDRIVTYKNRQVFWFSQITLDAYLTDIERDRE